MLRGVSVALLLVAAPAMAADEIKVDASGQAYKEKKVCRTVEVAGSFIPRTTCTTRKIPVKKPAGETQEAVNTGNGAADETAKAPQDQ